MNKNKVLPIKHSKDCSRARWDGDKWFNGQARDYQNCKRCRNLLKRYQ